MYQKGETTGSNPANRKLVENSWDMVHGRSLAEEELLFDPQTSGGLLLSLPAAEADDLFAALKKAGVDTIARVGKVVGEGKPFVRVLA
jgi:selenide,water dikinase